MDDTAALRSTLRRCTAVVVVGLGLIAANTHPYDPSNSFGYLLAYLAVGYLALSLLVGLFRSAAGSSDSARSSPPGGDDVGGSDGDGGANSDEADGSDDAEDAQRSPTATPGGDLW